MAGLEIVCPADNTVFDIAPGTAATGAVMPTIQAQVRFVGMLPDPTPATTFHWLIEIRLQCSDCSNGKAREINDQFRLTTLGGDCAIQFPNVRGGELTISVGADLPAMSFRAVTKGLRIRGVNPPRDVVNTACGTASLQKMVLQESRRRQFNAAADTGASNSPLFSGDRLGGVGLLQITNPHPTDDDHWNWLANLNHGIQIFNSKRRIARAYPGLVRKSKGFRQLVQAFNAARTPPAAIVLPDFTAVELELDTIRGYNGWAGKDAFGNALHEFRVPVDDAGNLAVTVDPENRGIIAWERVPPAERPRNAGDPDYVGKVLSQTP